MRPMTRRARRKVPPRALLLVLLLLALHWSSTYAQSVGGASSAASSAAAAGQGAASKAAQDQIYGPPNRYPQTTLKCYSTFQKPDGKSICPEARAKFCVKEVSNLRQDLCGHTQYFGDEYKDSVCVLRKCSTECKDEVISFQYGDLSFTRQRTCCTSDYCNAGSGSAAGGVVTLVCVLALSLLLLLR